MRFKDAMQFTRDYAGFRVSFEKDGIVDCFPAASEETILSQTEAWGHAERFARAGKDEGIVNVYVVHGNDYTPVSEKRLNG